MVEETPDNLGGFGGWTAGRAADDNRGIDRATDRLESEINRFSDALERLTSSLGGAQSSAGGGQQTRSANGGGATFGGQPAGAHRAEPSHRGMGMFAQAGSTIGAALPTQNGGAHATTSHRGPGVIRQNRGNIIAGAGVAAVGGIAAFTANHYSNQQTSQTLASMYAGGPDWNAAYQSGMTRNYTAHGDRDFQAMSAALGQRSGYLMGSTGYNQVRGQIQSYSAVNPSITNAQGTAAAMSLSSTTSYNKMARLGINPLGAGGSGDPRAVARQLLSKMGGTSGVRNADQVAAAFGPSGPATVTLDSFVAAGALPPESRNLVESEMRNILMAHIKGVSAGEYNKLSTAANTSEAARDRLAGLGIATNTQTQLANRSQGKRRDSEAETIVGFDQGVRGATKAVDAFRSALNKVLAIPGVGETAGLFSGATGTMPVLGSLLNRLPGGSGISGMFQTLGGGDGPSSMSASQMSYGGSSGAGAASAGFGAAGISARPAAGVASSGSSAPAGNRYSLGPVKPWVAKAASILGPKFGISTIGGVAARSTPSDHPKGLALDFMCGKTAGDGLAAYAVANHKALNITYVIWRQRIWSINNPRWTGMEDRGDPTSNHFDHVHVSFLASPTNGDFTGLPSSSGMGSGKGRANLGQGASSPDNGAAGAFATSAGGGFSGGFSEVAALGISSSGVAGAGGGAGGMSAGGSTGGGSRGRGSGGIGNIGSGFGSGAAGVVKSGTYNVGSLKGRTNPDADIEKLIGPADVLALTEVNPQRLAALRRALSDDNWGVYAGDGSASGSYALDASIAYDKDKYKLVKGGTYKLGDQTGNFLGGRGKRFANYALLQDKESGMSFWQVAAHTVPMANADMPHRKMHREQFDSLDALSAMLKKTGIPVIMGGDFNQQRNRDFWRNPDGMSSARGGGVDHVFGQNGLVKTTNLDMVGGLSGDHSGAVLATMSIKGTGGGGRKAGNGGTPSQNMALGRALAAARGWSGAQWDDLKRLWMHESGWRTDADNPTSSAYGIPQALTELHNLGNQYKTDPKTQINWGLNYIAGRYGNPSKAWDFWQRNNWYSVGEWDIRDDKDARVHKGEMIVPSKIADVVREELAAPGINDALGRRKAGGGGGGGTQVIFQAGAIVVTIPGGATQQQSEKAGRWLVDAMMEDARFKALTEGG